MSYKGGEKLGLWDFFKRGHTLNSPSSEFVDALGGRPSVVGLSVNEKTAMRTSAVWACVKLISEDVASLPLILYRRDKNDGKERATDQKLYRLLHDQANEEMTALQFRETMQAHALLYGNGRAYIERYNSGEIAALWPLNPATTILYRHDDKSLWYITTDSDGVQVKLPARDVLDICGLSMDGLIGLSPIRQLMTTVGISMAAEEYGARFFGNGANVSGVLEHPGKLRDADVLDRLRAQFEKMYTGLTKSHKVMILEEGMKFNRTSIPPDEAQFIETRKFQISDIARIYRVPPHKIGDLEHATFSNIEHQAIEYVQHTLRPWLVRWEQAIQQKLLVSKPNLYAEHLIDALLRGDIKSRYEAYGVGVQHGFLTRNMILKKENEIPVAEGDIFYVPVNMIPSNLAGDFWKSKMKGGITNGQNGTPSVPD